MTTAKKKKHVFQEIISSSDDRLPADNEKIVRVLCPRGNYLFEAEEIGNKNEKFLVSMPVKFRNTVWVKRGDPVLVTEIAEGDKVKAEISEVLTRKRISLMKSAGIWPEKDDGCVETSAEDFVNKNRRVVTESESSSSSEDD